MSAMARVWHTSTMTRSGDNKKNEYLVQELWFVAILFAKYLAGTYQAPLLALISPSPMLFNLNPALSMSRGSYPTRTQTTQCRRLLGDRVSKVFSSASGLITTIIRIHLLQPIHSSPPPSRWPNRAGCNIRASAIVLHVDRQRHTIHT